MLTKDNVNIFKAGYSSENNSSYASSCNSKLKCTNTDLSCGDGRAGSPAWKWPCLADKHDFTLAGPGKCCFGHGRGMCQFGSQAWALKGFNWQCILDHYYNDNGNRTGNGTRLRTAFLWGSKGLGTIAFMSFRDGNLELYVMNADGSAQTRLTNNPAYDGDPSWSPDGKRIAFGSFRGGNAEIYVMNADGSAQTRLTNNPAYDADPNWRRCPRFVVP
ncbi:MAG: hypothetical protein ACRERV_00715 [Methylococcales bacterium]